MSLFKRPTWEEQKDQLRTIWDSRRGNDDPQWPQGHQHSSREDEQAELQHYRSHQVVTDDDYHRYTQQIDESWDG